MSTPADRNLLFGLAALQMDFVSRAQLLHAMNTTSAADEVVGDVLQRQGVLSAERRRLLDALVNEQLRNGRSPQHESLGDALTGDDDSAATRAGTLAAPAGAEARFRVLRPHAEGGLGKVSVALDTELMREVALKEIKERYADNPDSRARFMLEAEITGGLEHPGIVPVYALGQYLDGRPFYAMRLIRGDSLKEAIARFHQGRSAESGVQNDLPVPPSKVGNPDFQSLYFRKLLNQFIEVCNAIAYAHSRGVLHRDLKPANVMLGKYGETLVVDWGLAKAGIKSQESSVGNQKSEMPQGATSNFGASANAASSSDEAPLVPSSGSGSSETVAGSAIGTPQFMSPEQAAGRLDLLGPPSDVYSLGATLFCLLTGQAPIEEQDVSDVMRKVQKGDFARPRTVQRAIPAALEAICLRAMALRPHDRYPSPRELAEEVERWLADERVLAYAEPPRVRIWRWARRHRTFVSAAAGLLLASAILLGISTATFRVLHKEADVLRDRADKALRVAQRTAYVNAINLAHENWKDADLKNIPKLLEDAGAPELRSWEWGHLKLMLHGAARSLQHPRSVTDLAVSPDGKRLATVLGDGSVRLWNMASGQEIATIRDNAPGTWLRRVAFNPDGDSLLTEGKMDDGARSWSQFRSWRALDGQPLATLAKFPVATVLALSREGTRLATASGATAKLWEFSTGGELSTLPHDGDIAALAFSSDGKWLATGGGSGAQAPLGKDQAGEVKIWDVATGKKMIALPQQWQRVTQLAFHPQSTELAVGSDNGLLTRWDPIAGKISNRPIWESGGAIVALAYSPDGAWLASAADDRSVTLANLKTGGAMRAIRGHTEHVSTLAFDRDSRFLLTASADATVKFWDLSEPGDYLTAAGGHALAMHPGGKTLAVAGNNVRLIDAVTGREILTYPSKREQDEPTGVAFDAKGARLAVGGASGMIRFWNAEGGPETLVFKGHEGRIHAMAYSPVLGGMLATAGADGLVKFFSESGQAVRTLTGHRRQAGMDDSVFGVAFSPDGKHLASGGADGMIRLWDVNSGKELKTIQTGASRVAALAFHPEGKRLASIQDALARPGAGGGTETIVKIWDLATGQEDTSVRGNTGDYVSIAFTRDGRRLVAGTRGSRIKFWDIICGQVVFEMHLFPIFAKQNLAARIAFSPDGLTLAATSPSMTLLWRATPWDAPAGESTRESGKPRQ